MVSLRVAAGDAPGSKIAWCTYLMADLENDLNHLRERCSEFSERLIRVEVKMQSLCGDIGRARQDFERHEQRHEENRQHVPVTLIGVISAVIMAVGVLAQIWLARGP